MKKIFIALSLIAFAFVANAKTIQELAKEYQALQDSGETQWHASQAVYTANTADVVTAFETWKNTNEAKFSTFEDPTKNLTDEQKKEVNAVRAIMTHYFIENPEKMNAAPARVVYIACPSKCYTVFSAVNPNFYQDLKSADFVVDGIKLPTYSRAHIAKSAGDNEYITSLTIAEGLQSPDIYFATVIESLLGSKDIEASKSKCCEIENYFINKKMFNSPYLSQIQAVNKVLTARLVDKKITGK